jgi:GNAT superfamily N-acetyltransferase
VNEPAIVIRPVGRPGDLGWMVKAHGEIYAAEYGWDFSFEALVARIVADFGAAAVSANGDGPARMAGDGRRRQAGWIAEIDGRRAGCVLCVPIDEITAQLRILLVAPAARGHGIGAALVDECLSFAASAGYRRMRLWTNHPLAAARRIYLSRGFMLTEEERHHSYGADLTGQIYELELVPELSRPGDAR